MFYVITTFSYIPSKIVIFNLNFILSEVLSIQQPKLVFSRKQQALPVQVSGRIFGRVRRDYVKHKQMGGNVESLIGTK